MSRSQSRTFPADTEAQPGSDKTPTRRRTGDPDGDTVSSASCTDETGGGTFTESGCTGDTGGGGGTKTGLGTKRAEPHQKMSDRPSSRKNPPKKGLGG